MVDLLVENLVFSLVVSLVGRTDEHLEHLSVENSVSWRAVWSDNSLVVCLVYWRAVWLDYLLVGCLVYWRAVWWDNWLVECLVY